MRFPRLLCAVVPLVVLAPVQSSAQSEVPSRQRVRWAAPPQALDSTSIQLRIVDFATGKPIPALICFRTGTEVVSDPDGEARVTGLRQTNTWVSVLSSNYEATFLIFFPGKLGRSFATVPLVPSANAPARPTCGDAVWPA